LYFIFNSHIDEVTTFILLQDRVTNPPSPPEIPPIKIRGPFFTFFCMLCMAGNVSLFHGAQKLSKNKQEKKRNKKDPTCMFFFNHLCAIHFFFSSLGE